MKGAIFDTMPSLNSNPAKNKFLSACSSPSAAMPTACPSFMKIIRQFHDNFSHPTTAIAKTERNVNNYHNAPLALFRNSSMPVRFPLVALRSSRSHLNYFWSRRSRIRFIMYISFRKNPQAQGRHLPSTSSTSTLWRWPWLWRCLALFP